MNARDSKASTRDDHQFFVGQNRDTKLTGMLWQVRRQYKAIYKTYGESRVCHALRL